MSSATERAAFKTLTECVNKFVEANANCRIDNQSSKSILILFGPESDFSHIEVRIGSFNVWLSISDCLIGHTPLSNDKEVNRLMAICDAILAGRGVSISLPAARISRTWLFLDSRGIKETIRVSRTLLGARRLVRFTPRRHWQRHKLPILTNEIA